MNKVAVVLGVAAVATLAGCKDPDYVKGNASTQDDVKQVPVEETVTPATVQAEATPVKPTCKCAPGTKHTSPCACGADDCRCIVEVKPVKPAEPEFTVYYVQNGDSLSKISKKFNVTIAAIKKLNNMTSDALRVGQKLKLPGKVDVGTASSKPVVQQKQTTKKVYTSYSGATKEYVVKNGDTLGGIAYANGINVRQLKELNGLSKDALKIGQKLKIPAEKVVKPAAEKKVVKPAPAKTEAKKVEAPVKPAEPAPAAPAPAAEPEKPVEAAPAATEPAPAAPAPAAAEPAQSTVATTTYVVQPNEDIQAVAIRFGITTAEIRELNNLGETDTIKAGQAIKLPADAQQ